MENYGLDGGRVMVMVMEELERGRDLATQLRRVLVNSAEGTPACAKDLAEKVVTSFSNTLLLLKNDQSYSPKSDDSADSCKSTTSAFTKRRPSYKRRRTSQTSEIESEAPIDDGHAWRKYGQKNIMNATYPRNYFRCSHKFEQGCQATKQVQRIQEKPALYRTTYCGTHTCNRTSLGNHIVLDAANSPSHDDAASIFISFDHNNLPSHQPFFSSSPSLPFTQTHCKQEILSSSSEDYVLSPPSHVSDIFYDDLQLDHFDF